MKALIRFSYGALIFDPGDEVEDSLSEDEMQAMEGQGLIGESDDEEIEKEDYDDEIIKDVREKRVIHKPGKKTSKR